MRTVLTIALASATLVLAGCNKPAPLPEPGSNQAAQLAPTCTLLETAGEAQTFRCPGRGELEYRQFGNDEISGPPCFINNTSKYEGDTLYQVVCPAGQRYDLKKGEWLGLFYRG